MRKTIFWYLQFFFLLLVSTFAGVGGLLWLNSVTRLSSPLVVFCFYISASAAAMMTIGLMRESFKELELYKTRDLAQELEEKLLHKETELTGLKLKIHKKR